MDYNKGFWYKLVHLDPALWRALVVATVALLASIGIKVSDQIPDNLILFVLAVMGIIQALWTRNGVTPNAKVLAYLPKPIEGPNIVAAGEATTNAPDSKVLDAVRTEARG